MKSLVGVAGLKGRVLRPVRVGVGVVGLAGMELMLSIGILYTKKVRIYSGIILTHNGGICLSYGVKCHSSQGLSLPICAFQPFFTGRSADFVKDNPSDYVLCVKLCLMPTKFTKIVATIGPASESPEMLEKLAKAGANLFRLNTKHNSLEWHLEVVSRIKNLSKQQSINSLAGGIEANGSEDAQNPGIIIDLQGPEANSRNSKESMEAPSLCEKDLEILQAFSKTPKSHPDYIALSFVRSQKDVTTLKTELTRLNLNSRIIAKIENQAGLDNIDKILQVADAVMIARGDLGNETPPEKIPYLQKIIINKCRAQAKPVIVATEMLLSMVEKPVPTRAEVADVANAVYDRTDAVMLSEETAIGKHPLEAVETMVRVVAFNEHQALLQGSASTGSFGSTGSLGMDFMPDSLDQTHAIVKSALSMLEPFSGVAVSKLIVGTQTGYTAQVFSSFRPRVQVLALSDKLDTVGALGLSFGVEPVFVDSKTMEEGSADPEILLAYLKGLGLLESGDMALLVQGQRTNDPGKTNSVVVLGVR